MSATVSEVGKTFFFKSEIKACSSLEPWKIQTHVEGFCLFSSIVEGLCLFSSIFLPAFYLSRALFTCSLQYFASSHSTNVFWQEQDFAFPFRFWMNIHDKCASFPFCSFSLNRQNLMLNSIWFQTRNISKMEKAPLGFVKCCKPGFWPWNTSFIYRNVFILNTETTPTQL